MATAEKPLDTLQATPGGGIARKRDGDGDAGLRKKKAANKAAAAGPPPSETDIIRTQLTVKSIPAARRIQLLSRKGKKKSDWIFLDRSWLPRSAVKSLLSDSFTWAPTVLKETDKAYHVSLNAVEFQRTFPAFPAKFKCRWTGPVRIPRDEPYGIYHTDADIVSAELRWSSELKMMITAVRATPTF